MKTHPDHSQSLDLHQPLPPDMVAGLTCWPLRYRRYPVFSWRWWKGRMLTSLGFIFAYAGIGVIGTLAAGEAAPKVAITWGYFIAGGLLMVNLGPALATWLRTLSAPASPRGWAMVAVAMLGFGIAFGADAWASSGIRDSLGKKRVPESERRVSDLDEARLKLSGLWALFLYFALGGGLATLAYFSELRRLRARAALLRQLGSDMRLSVLQAQLEPHFLFNTLAAIRPLLREDAPLAEAALDALVDHLRAVLPRTNDGPEGIESTLGLQLDVCESYLKLMKLRMGERLSVSIEAPELLRCHPFPPLMLVSLVENAIKHGLEPKPGDATLRITASASDDKLSVIVEDDGVGLSGGLSSGVGLANIREQLLLRFGNGATLEVAGRKPGGTVAAINVPFQPSQS